MTVLDTRDPYIQYTGTGSRLYFEYGFAWNGETVVVEVDGVPVAFEYQANGVYLAVAPALGAAIVIWRETDITQERNFTAFDAFVGRWTEDALDKLILLKQEAAIWRAQTNLRANHKLDRVTIENTQGTDPDIFLWNFDQSGVFAGEVTTQMPAVGQVVPKPWDFAYFQYGNPAEVLFRDYEVIYLMASSSYTIRAIGVDYIGKTWTEYGTAFAGAEQAIDIDETSTYLFRDGGTGNINQYVWRGTCFSVVHSELHEGLNGTQDLLTLSSLQQFMAVGEEAFGHGMRDYSYETAAPFNFATVKTHTPANDFWNGLFDLRFGNNQTPNKGDAVVATPQNGNAITTFRNNSGVLFSVDQLIASSLGNKAAWSCDRDSGILTSHFTASALFRAYQIDMSDLTISYIGELSPTDNVVFAVAAVPDETDMFITCEDTGGANDIVRTYRHDGMGGLTKLDELALTGSSPNTLAHFRVSPFTKRIWLLSQNQCNAYEVDSAGLITLLIDLPYSVGSSGSTSNFIAFAADPDGLNITTNGFTGIKQKLYECWECNEVGSVTRVGAMGNADMYVNVTAIPDRPGIIGNAADFGAASNFYVSPAGGSATVPPVELMTQGSFSFCRDVLFDVINVQQYLFVRGKLNGSSASDFDLGCYVDASNKLHMWVRVGSTTYDAQSTVTVSAGTNYHIYGEYDKTNQTVGISVNNETLVTTALPAASSINAFNGVERRFTVGRASSALGDYMDGYQDQIFWFWDTLTSAQRTFMYNSGGSRSFSEL